MNLQEPCFASFHGIVGHLASSSHPISLVDSRSLMPGLVFVSDVMRSPEALDDGSLPNESVRPCLSEGETMWMVWLKGNPEHLSLCRYFFEDGPQRICHEGDGFVFCYDNFNDCKSSADFLVRAKDSLELALGADALASGEHFDVAITGCLIKVDEDSNHCCIMKAAAGTVEMGWSARLLSSGDCHAPLSYLLAAERDKHLSLALQLWGDKQRAWPRLYRIAEEIQRAFGKEGQEQACARSSRETSCATAPKAIIVVAKIRQGFSSTVQTNRISLLLM
jgi:hypothetical protein